MFLYSIFAHLVHNLFVCLLSILLYQSRPHQEGNHSQRLTEKVKAFCQQATSSTRKPLITSCRARRGQMFWVGCQRSLARPVDVGEGVPQNPWLGWSNTIRPLPNCSPKRIRGEYIPGSPFLPSYDLLLASPALPEDKALQGVGWVPRGTEHGREGGDEPRGQPARSSSWNETPRGQLC